MTIQLDSARFTRTELDKMRHASIEVADLCQTIIPGSLALWALRRYDQAVAYARDHRGLNAGRLVCVLGFCAGFDAGGDIPASRLIGAQQDHVLAFLAGAALRDFVERAKDNQGTEMAEGIHERINAIRETLHRIHVELHNREEIQA